MLALILLVLALVFTIVGFVNGAAPWHGIALLLVILTLLLPKVGA